jgi:hypothetical protein
LVFRLDELPAIGTLKPASMKFPHGKNLYGAVVLSWPWPAFGEVLPPVLACGMVGWLDNSLAGYRCGGIQRADLLKETPTSNKPEICTSPRGIFDDVCIGAGTCVSVPCSTNMAEDVLFGEGDVSITRKLARFGHTVYQIANISAVSVNNTRRMNVAALTFISFGIGIFIAGVIAGLVVIGTGLRSGISIWFYAVGFACVLVGIVIQLIWPRRCFVLTLTTTAGDVEALASEDNEHVAAVEFALEKAFAERP